MSMSLGTLAITASKPVIFQAPNDGVKAILIGCESGLTCTVTMESGGVQKTLYPGTVDWFSVNKGFNGNIKISPIAILNNVSTFPASTLVFDAIGLNDSEQASMYPLALPSRNTNIGNSVNTVGGGSNFIQNDANNTGTSIMEATVSGDSASAVSLTNDAIMTLGSAAHKGSLTALGPVNGQGGLVAGTNGSGKQLEFLDSTGTPQNVMGVDGSNILRFNLTPSGDRMLFTDSLQTENYLDFQTSAIILGDSFTKLPVTLHGNLNLADGTLTVSGISNFTGVINANGGLNTNTLRDDTNGNTALDLSAGTGDVTMPKSLTVQTRLNLALGSLSKISFFSGTANATGGFVNHGLGVKPDFVFITMTGSVADTCSFFYNPATMTTTQVFIFATNGVATARAFVALAVKL